MDSHLQAMYKINKKDSCSRTFLINLFSNTNKKGQNEQLKKNSEVNRKRMNEQTNKSKSKENNKLNIFVQLLCLLDYLLLLGCCTAQLSHISTFRRTILFPYSEWLSWFLWMLKWYRAKNNFLACGKISSNLAKLGYGGREERIGVCLRQTYNDNKFLLTHWGRGHLNCLNARSRGLNNLNQILYCVSLNIYNKFANYFCELKFSGNTQQRP